MTSPAANDYPRWMFHRTLAPVIIHSEEEETALGPEWSRRIGGPPQEEEPGGEQEPEEAAETAPWEPAVKRGRGKQRKTT